MRIDPILKDPEKHFPCSAMIEKKQQMKPENKKNTFGHYVAGFVLIALATTVLYLTNADPRSTRFGLKREENEERLVCEKDESFVNDEQSYSQNGPIPGCNLFSGRWVFDNISLPLYKEEQCSFLNEQQFYACEKNGRKDLTYQQWRWQPHGCNLPRFNGTVLLEKIRGKKLVFVGDSLNRNQWASMLCLVESSIPPSSPKSIKYDGNFYSVHVTDYNATIGFYWSPMLVESNCDDPDQHSERNRIIRITSIEKHAKHWTDADLLIFNSFMWWLEPTMTILWGQFGDPNAIYKKVEMRLRRYEMAISTWSDWLEINIDRTKTKLFFMSLSPFHFNGESLTDDRMCYNETGPILKEGYKGVESDHEMMHIVESAIQKLETKGVKLQYMNITQLSDYRIDAHPSIYKKLPKPPSEEQLKDPKSVSDCVHWCLPGVPDVWNEILYSYIINS